MSTLKGTIGNSFLYRRNYQLNGKTINFDRPATIALETMSPEEKEPVTKAINQLPRSSEKDFAYIVKKLDMAGNVYVLRVDDFRIIYEVDGNVIEITDIFHKDRLKIFANTKDKASMNPD